MVNIVYIVCTLLYMKETKTRKSCGSKWRGGSCLPPPVLLFIIAKIDLKANYYYHFLTFNNYPKRVVV